MKLLNPLASSPILGPFTDHSESEAREVLPEKHLGGLREVMTRRSWVPRRAVISAVARSRDPDQKKEFVVLMDGALSLWALIARLLSGVSYVGILDIIHVVEYLWLAGNALYGEKRPKTTLWVQKQLLLL